MKRGGVHIILVSSRLAKARSLTLTNGHLVAGTVFMALLVFSLTLGLFWITVRHAAEFKLPLLDSLVLSAQEAQRRKTEEFLRENLNASLGILESQLFDAKVKKKLMPTIPPVDGGWSASSFGWRIDPFNGMLAMHEGVDFVVGSGTPVFAAAGGVVEYAGSHYQYGNMVE